MSLGQAAGTDTHCPYCALQCGMRLHQDQGTWTVTARDFPTNKGGLCRKGWTAAALLDHPDRLTTPLLRDTRDAPLRPVSWEEALDRVVAGMRAVQASYGVDAMGVFGGGGLTNEKAYMLGKFARLALRTANIDYNGRFCMASSAAAHQIAFGLDRGLPFPLEDIPTAEAILVTGSNPAETMPPIMQYFEEQKRRGGRLVVSDPRRTPMAQAASLHLQLTPGTDAALANGMLHVAIQRHLIDNDFIADRTIGFDAVRRMVAAYWPDRVERITGVPADQIVRATHILGEAATAMILSGRGSEQQSQGVNNSLAFINLALALGKAGRRGSGWGCFTGQGNGQGGREHGQKADQLPGYRKLADPRHRADVAAVWGVDPDSLPQPGLSACEMLAGLGTEGGIRGLFVLACNLLVSGPDAGRIRARMDDLDLLVVGDQFLSETSSRADVVLPVTQWAEEDGTMTNLEGRVIRRRRAKLPPQGVWTDTEILQALATRLGCGALFSGSMADIASEFRRATAGGPADYAGITWDRIDQENGVFWPCPAEDHAGTPRLFLDRFATGDGRARFTAVRHLVSAEEPDDAYPLFLTTGRVMLHYQTGAQTRRVAELAAAEPDAFIEIHPDTARGMSVAHGDAVRLVTRRGALEVIARLTNTIRLDTIFMPFHWGGASNANMLTHAALDPVSRIPEYKVCAVRIERIASVAASSPELRTEVKP